MRHWVLALTFVTLAAPALRGQGAPQAQAQLTRTADAILALKSTRFSLKREGKPAVLDEKTGITFTNADCGYAAPDRVTCNIKVALKSGTILQLTRVWVPEGMFQSNPLTRQFVKMPADGVFDGPHLFSKEGIPQLLKTSVQKPQIVGKEPLQNRTTLHVKGEVRGEQLNRVIGAMLKPELSYPVDLWLDEQTAHPMQLRTAEPEGGGWLIELAGFNEPIDIPTPKPPTAPARPPA